VVDEIASVLDPLPDCNSCLVKDGIYALANTLLRDIKDSLGVVLGYCKCSRDEGEEG
jgi:hypothetical protein